MATPEQLITEHLDIWSSAIQTKSAAGRGKSNKLELYGIKKLRELILDLAVRGLLVPQDPNDESASELLKKIAVEKAQLVKDGRIKEPKALPAIEDDKLPFELPNGWAWTRIVEISQVGPRNEASDDDQVSFVPMSLITTNYDGGHGQETREWSEVKKGYTHFADGDFAIAKITPCFENSKAAIFSGLKNGIGAGTTELHVARPYGEFVNRRYALLYLKAPQFLSVGEGRMTGTAGQKRVPKDFFALNPLPFPPLAEQNRIVAKVDELMALCDQLEQQQESSIAAHQTLVKTLLDALTTAIDRDGFTTAWTRIADHFDTLFTTEWSINQLKQTILQLAVMGKLVPQDPKDEPAGERVGKAIQAKERLGQERRIRKDKMLYKSNEVFRPPQGWVWGCIGEVAHVLGGKRVPRGYKLLDAPTDHVYIRVTDMKNQTVLKSDLKYIDDEIFEQISKYIINKEDVYVTIAGTIGDVGLLPPELDGMNLTENASKLVFREIEKSFLVLALSSTYIQDQFAEAVNQMAQPKLSLTSIKHTSICIPPIEEQRRIVAKVDELAGLCESLRIQLNENQVTLSNLADAFSEQRPT